MKDELIEFPCDFPIKAMGRSDVDLHLVVEDIVRRHVREEHITTVHTNASSKGNYVSITVTVVASNRAQLDAIYQALTDHDAVIAAF